MDQNKIRAYLLYAVGEILLVVIGILIALQVNNWNEERKAANVSDSTIQKLYAEIEVAKDQVESSLNVNKIFLNWSDKYLYSDTYTDSLKNTPDRIFRLISYASITLDIPVVNQELGSGQLIKGNTELLVKLRQINSEYEEVASLQQSAKNLWNEYVIGYFIEKNVQVDFSAFISGKDYDADKVVRLLYDEEYKNIVSMANSVNLQLVNKYEQLLNYLNETLKHIESID